MSVEYTFYLAGKEFYRAMATIAEFAPGYPLKSPDDYPTVPFKYVVKTSVQFGIVKHQVYGKDDASATSVVPADSATLLFYRFPHWFNDILSLKLKEPPNNKKIDYIYCLMCDLYNAWMAKDNIEQKTVPAPTLKKKHTFNAIGTNQFVSAGFSYSGKKNKPHSLRLYLFCSADNVWVPQELCFPSHNGVILVEGKFGMIIVCKSQLRYYQLTNSQLIENEPKWTYDLVDPGDDEWMYELRSAFDKIAFGLPDGKIQILDAVKGEPVITFQPRILPCSFAMTYNALAVGSDENTLEFFNLKSEENQSDSGLNYAVVHKTVSKKKIQGKKDLVAQMRLQGQKLVFSVDDQIYMDDRGDLTPALRIMEEFPVVAIGFVANMVIVVQSNGNVFVSGFGERTAVFSTKVEYDGTKPWRYNVQYISGTISHINVLFPDGQVLVINPIERIIQAK